MSTQGDLAERIKKMILEEMPGPQRHPFHRKVLEGRATRADLAAYAVQTYHRNLYSSRFASANHSRCPVPEIRRALLQVVKTEEESAAGEAPSHAELMLVFAEAVGVKREDVIHSEPLPSTRVFIDTIMQLSQGHWLEGISFRASELGAPRACKLWYEALQKHYSFSTKEVAWWKTHVEEDVAHGNIALQVYSQYARGEDNQAMALRAVKRMMAAWQVFDDGILKAGEEAAQGKDAGFPVPAEKSF